MKRKGMFFCRGVAYSLFFFLFLFLPMAAHGPLF